LDKITATKGARVINVASMAHKQGDMDFDNLMYENGEGYSRMKAYGRSKLANLLFSYQLQRFFEEKNIDAISVAAHPGASMTNLFSHMLSKSLTTLLKPLLSLIVQPANIGALPQIRASVDPGVKGGEYYGPRGMNEMRGYPIKVKSNELSNDKKVAEELWKRSESLTGIKFNA
jgi:NAD(P)-dependent dehydrogenase (short-subunit alcohol dehydrogenase family)